MKKKCLPLFKEGMKRIAQHALQGLRWAANRMVLHLMPWGNSLKSQNNSGTYEMFHGFSGKPA